MVNAASGADGRRPSNTPRRAGVGEQRYRSSDARKWERAGGGGGSAGALFEERH